MSNVSTQEKMDLMADEVIDYLEKLKSEYKCKVNENLNILSELDYDISTDLPFDIHKYFDDVADKCQDFTLNEDLPNDMKSLLNVNDIQSVADNIATTVMETKLKREIAYINAMISDLQKEEINLKRQIESCKHVTESMKDRAMETEIKSMQLQATLNNYAIKLQNLEISEGIVSKFEEIKHLHEERKQKKEEIVSAELNLEKYCGLPPNIKQAKEFIAEKMKEKEKLKQEMNRLISEK